MDDTKRGMDKAVGMESSLKVMLDQNCQMIYILDAKTHTVQYANRQFEKIMGKTPKGTLCHKALFDADDFCSQCCSREFTAPMEVLLKNGMWALAQASPVVWENQDMLVVTLTDVSRQKRLENELSLRNEEYALILSASERVIARYELKTRVITVFFADKDSAAENLIFKNVPESLIESGKIAETSAQAARGLFESIHAGKKQGGANIRMYGCEDKLIWMRVDYTLSNDEQGRPQYALMTLYDNTEQVEKERVYEKMRSYINRNVSDKNRYMEANLTTNEFNRSKNTLLVQTLGINPQTYDDFVDKACHNVVCKEDEAAVREFMARERLLTLHASGVHSDCIEYRVRVGSTTRWNHTEAQLATNPLTDETDLFLIFTDIDEQKRSLEKLTIAASHDSMTGMLHHDAAFARIAQFLNGEGKSGAHALFMIDIDNFKSVNDRFGHQMGDKIIKDIAQAIKKAFRDTDICGRIGGDEYLVLMKNIGQPETVRKKAKELVTALQYYCSNGNNSLQLTCSVGVSRYIGDGSAFEKLYARADVALYQAKAEGKNRCVMFSEATKLEGREMAPSGITNTMQLHTLLDNMDAGVIVGEIDKKIKITYVSPGFTRSFDEHEEDISGDGELLLKLTAPEDKDALEDGLRGAARTGKAFDMTYRVINKRAGGYEWRHIRCARLPESEDNVKRVIAVVTDVTALKRSEEKQRFAERKYKTALGLSTTMMWEVDVEAQTLVFTGALASRLGLADKPMRFDPDGVYDLDCVRSDSREVIRSIHKNILNGEDGKNYIITTVDRYGRETPIRTHFTLLRGESGKLAYAVGLAEPTVFNFKELSIYRAMEGAGAFSMRTDEPLTLLYGNDKFYSLIEYAREDMKKLNADECARVILPEDLAIVREYINSAQKYGETTAAWTIRVVTGSGAIKYVKINGTFEDAPDGSRVLSAVALDVTGQMAKKPEARNIPRELNSALTTEQFSIALQPQYDYSTKRIVGAEALARWQHPAKGLLTPDSFISAFEKNGFITRLDYYVWEQVCALMREWMDEGKKCVPISVNVSRVDLFDPTMLETLTGILKKYGLENSALRLEITEAAYHDDSARLIDAVSKLRTRGFAVELDNYGSGKSSLSILNDVPVDALKLDMRLLSDSQNASRSGNILSSIVRMARWLELPVIAEGVETHEQADYLKSVGCTMMQGYYFARPMSVDDFGLLLNDAETAARVKAQSNVEAAAKLWDASARSALIFNSISSGAAIIERRGSNVEMLRANDRFFEILGATRERFKKYSLKTQTCFTDGTSCDFMKMLDEAAKSEKECSCETKNVLLSGKSPKWTLNRARLLSRGEGGDIFYLSFENITEIKLLEAEIGTLAAKLDTLAAGLPCGVVNIEVSHKANRVTYYNETLFAMLGYTLEQFKKKYGADILQGVHPDDLNMLRQEFAQMNTQPNLQRCFRLRALDAESGWRWLEANCKTVEKKDGRCNINVIVMDIDRMVKMEKLNTEQQTEMERQFEQIHYLYDMVSFGIMYFTIDCGGIKLTDYNTRAWQILGYENERDFYRDSAIRYIERNVQPDGGESIEKLAKQAIETDRRQEEMIKVKHKNDEIKNIRVAVTKKRAGGAEYIQCAMFEII